MAIGYAYIYTNIIHCYSLHLLCILLCLGRGWRTISTSKGVECDSTFIVLKYLYIQFCWTSVPMLVKYASIVGLSDPPPQCLCPQKYFSNGSWLKTSLRRYFTPFWRSRGPSSVKDLTACTDFEINFSYTHTHTYNP